MKSVDKEKVEEIRHLLDRPVALIGMMGVGKTKMGRLLSDVLEQPFVDSDEEIEKAAGMMIAEIFDRFGEPYFRDGERRVIKRILDRGKGVIATGGGSVMIPETAAAIWDNTISVWIRADLAVMVERTSRTENRPLLQNGDPETILKELVEKRYPIYEKADIVIDSHNGPAEAMLNQALDKLHAYLLKNQRNTD